MDLLIIILSFLLAYGVFVVIAVKLARMFFPKIDTDDVDVKAGAVPQRRHKRAIV